MSRLKIIWVTLGIAASLVLAYASYRYGVQAQWSAEDRNIAAVQGSLAFTHYKMYEEIESYLTRQCYEAALTVAREFKSHQVVLLYDHLRESGNDPELVEYVRFRDPELLENVLAGRVPEVKPFETTCSQDSTKAKGP